MKYSDIIKYYSRKEICGELARVAASRETIVQYGLNKVGKRPDTIEFSADVKKLARQGATSFHTSEEIWKNPLELSQESTAKQMDELRSGWDLIIDIDSPNVDYGKVVAELILQTFMFHGIEGAGIKFSGNKGFHIGIPFKALPKSLRGAQIESLFPDAPRVIAKYLKEFIRPHLSKAILDKFGDLRQVIKDTGKTKEELLFPTPEGPEFDPYKIIELDTILIAPRHLFRMPYSLHEKSWLFSKVINESELKDFDRNSANPELVSEVRDWFLNPEKTREGEATQLIVQAFDWERKQTEKKVAEEGNQKTEFKGEIDAANFPPCIKQALGGLEDGRKRALFVLLNFFKCMNWTHEKIAFQINDWNSKNKPPLKTGYINSQLNWHKMHTGKVPPPNCESASYYKDIKLCKPIPLCKNCKNPLAFVARKIKK